MTNDEHEQGTTDAGDLSEEDIGHIMTIIATDGYYKQAEIVKVSCPACGRSSWEPRDTQGGSLRAIVHSMNLRIHLTPSSKISVGPNERWLSCNVRQFH